MNKRKSNLYLEIGNLNHDNQKNKFYSLNGAIYITSEDHFNSSNASDPFLIPETKFFIMDESKSIDVDSISDFKICEFMLKKLNKL